jgi:hypothetical protein
MISRDAFNAGLKPALTPKAQGAESLALFHRNSRSLGALRSQTPWCASEDKRQGCKRHRLKRLPENLYRAFVALSG